MTTLREFYGKDARGKNIRHVKASGHYGEFGNSHNVALNEDTGHIFVIGSGTCSVRRRPPTPPPPGLRHAWPNLARQRLLQAEQDSQGTARG
jgi:hypothetical protein